MFVTLAYLSNEIYKTNHVISIQVKDMLITPPPSDPCSSRQASRPSLVLSLCLGARLHVYILVIIFKISFHLLFQYSSCFSSCSFPLRPNIAHLKKHTILQGCTHTTPLARKTIITWKAVYPTAHVPAIPASTLNVHLVPSQLIKRPPKRLPEPFPTKRSV